MKKYVLSFITLFAMCLAFSLTSCGNDDEEGGGNASSSKLIGKWVLVKEEGYEIYKGEKDYFESTYKVSEESEVYEFKKNGTVRNYGYYIDEYGDKVKDFDISGEWILDGSMLTVVDSDDGEEGSVEIKKLTDSQLVFVYDEKDYYNEATYQKVD